MADRRRRRRREDEADEEDSGQVVDSEAKPQQGRRSECESEDEAAETEGAAKEKSEVKETKSKEKTENGEDDDDAEEEESEEDSEEETDDDDEDEDDEEEEEEEEEYEDVDVIIEDDGSWVEEERQSGDGEEQTDQKKELDDDEDRKNPAFIPRRGAFYEHDTRMGAQEKEMEEQRTKKKLWKENDKWIHDRFQQDEQAPKSREELIALYGYDIRAYDKPPDRAPPLRGRGRRGSRPYRKSEFGDFVERKPRNYNSNSNKMTTAAEITELDNRPAYNKTPDYRLQCGIGEDIDGYDSEKTTDNKKFDVKSQFDRFQQQRNLLDKAVRVTQNDPRSQDIRNQGCSETQSEQNEGQTQSSKTPNLKNQTDTQDHRNESSWKAPPRSHYEGQKESRNVPESETSDKKNVDSYRGSEYSEKKTVDNYRGSERRNVDNYRGSERRNVDSYRGNEYNERRNVDNYRSSEYNERRNVDNYRSSEYNDRRNVDNFRGRGRNMRRGRGSSRAEIAPRYSRTQNTASQSYSTQREFFNSGYPNVSSEVSVPVDDAEIRETSECQDVVISNKDRTISVTITNTTTEKKSYAKERHGKYMGVARGQDAEVAMVKVGNEQTKAEDKTPGSPDIVVDRKASHAVSVATKTDSSQQMRPKRYSSQRQRTAQDSNYTDNISADTGSNYYNQAYPSPGYHPERVPAPVFQHTDRVPVYQHPPERVPPSPAPVYQRPAERVAPAPPVYHADRVPVSAQEGAFQTAILQPPMTFTLPVSTAGLSSPPRIYTPSVPAPTVSIAGPTRLIPPQYLTAGVVYGSPPPPPGPYQMPVAFPTPPTGPPPPAPAPVQTAAVQGAPPAGPAGGAGPEVYHGGTTYYAPELQRASRRRSPTRRPKLAIPIVKPEDRPRGDCRSQENQGAEEGGQPEWGGYSTEEVQEPEPIEYSEDVGQQDWAPDSEQHLYNSNNNSSSVPNMSSVEDSVVDSERSGESVDVTNTGQSLNSCSLSGGSDVRNSSQTDRSRIQSDILERNLENDSVECEAESVSEKQAGGEVKAHTSSAVDSDDNSTSKTNQVSSLDGYSCENVTSRVNEDDTQKGQESRVISSEVKTENADISESCKKADSDSQVTDHSDSACHRDVNLEAVTVKKENNESSQRDITSEDQEKTTSKESEISDNKGEVINDTEENSSDEKEEMRGNRGDIVNDNQEKTAGEENKVSDNKGDVMSAIKGETTDNKGNVSGADEEQTYRAPVVHEFVVKRHLKVEDNKPTVQELGMSVQTESQTPGFAVDRQTSEKTKLTENIKVESRSSQ